jgi:hypothetical protein
MANENGTDRSLDSLFGLSKKRRSQALLDMLERNRRRNPPTVRFALAGIVTALEGEFVQDVAAAVADVLRAKIAKMEDD